MSSLVVGYDGSDCARAALRTAANLAAELTDTSIVVAFGFEVNPVGGELGDYRKALEEHGREVLSHATSQAAAEGITVEVVVIEGQPAEALVELARARDARAIIVGSRGESPLRGALIGSTPHKLLQLSDRPVLVVPE